VDNPGIAPLCIRNAPACGNAGEIAEAAIVGEDGRAIHAQLHFEQVPLFVVVVGPADEAYAAFSPAKPRVGAVFEGRASLRKLRRERRGEIASTGFDAR